MLELKNIHTHRGAVHVLNALSITVKDREVVCLVGRNGAGKTTVVETIMGYLPAQAGKIFLQGEDITGLPPYQRARGESVMPPTTRAFSPS